MNGYIQLEFNGEKIGLKFGFPAVREFSIAAEKKMDVYYDGGDLSLLGIAKLLHCGYKNNCEVKEVEPTKDLEFFSDLVEEATSNEDLTRQLGNALTVFADSRYVKMIVEKTKEAEDTKKKKPKKSLTK